MLLPLQVLCRILELGLRDQLEVEQIVATSLLVDAAITRERLVIRRRKVS